MTTERKGSNHVFPNQVNKWRFVEFSLLVAILFVGWNTFGNRVVTYINTKREARAKHQASLPKGGLVAKDSLNPFVFIPYQWHNFRSESPLLLPDVTPIIGEDLTMDSQYPNMEQWLIDTTSEPGRALLRVNTITANIGDGPLHIVGGEVIGDTEQQVVYQRIWRSDDTFVDRQAGQFVYHPFHDHIHFDHYAQYMLRLHDADGEVIAEGEKIGFCLTDVLSADQALIEAATVRIILPPLECGGREQAINTGYSDYYGHKLADQWIDITDVPYGDYQLQVVVDPNNLILESNEDNNRVSIPLNYTQATLEERAFGKWK